MRGSLMLSFLRFGPVVRFADRGAFQRGLRCAALWSPIGGDTPRRRLAGCGALRFVSRRNRSATGAQNWSAWLVLLRLGKSSGEAAANVPVIAPPNGLVGGQQASAEKPQH